MTAQMRTKRRYAHELYPHPGEYEVQPLDQAVPYLYARAIGLSIWGTDWFALGCTDDARRDEHGQVRPEFRLTVERTHRLLMARSAALHADALLQGLGGAEAWEWAEERACDEAGEIVYDRAVHYGVPVDRIKPYPVLAEPDHHDHHGEPDARGWREVTRVEGRESECPDCCEPVEDEGADQ